jgi:hypothetical protein
VDEVVDDDDDVVVLFAAVVEVVELFGAVVEVVELVEVVASVLGTVVVAMPPGSSKAKDLRAARSTAGGCGIVAPFGRKAIVIIWPFSSRVSSAFAAGTIVPFDDVVCGQVSTEMYPGFEPHFVTPFL